MSAASAAAVAPSYIEALATGRPVRSDDEGLELEDGLQRALGQLGLVGRVGGVELAAEQELVDRRRDVVRVGAGAEERHRRDPVLAADLVEEVDQTAFVERLGQLERALEPQAGGDGARRASPGEGLPRTASSRETSSSLWGW